MTEGVDRVSLIRRQRVLLFTNDCVGNDRKDGREMVKGYGDGCEGSLLNGNFRTFGSTLM